MKPSWDDAPEWAKWLAMDVDGAWSWFSHEPELVSGVWVPVEDDCFVQVAGRAFMQEVKEHRP